MIPNQWYAILPSKAVKANKIIGVKRLNLDLALFRNEAGEIGCVVNRCSHRGAALSEGKVKGDNIQCPFHGLEFDKTGQCILIPANGKASTADISRFNVKHYPVRESNDIVYLWYGEPDKMTEELPFFYEELDASHAYSEIADHWNSHYSRCIENQLDVIHLPFVHYNTIGRGNKTLVNKPNVELVPGGIITSSCNEVDVGQKIQMVAACDRKTTYLHFLFPNVWMNYISDKIKVMIYFAPVDDENTVLYLRFYCKITGFKPLDNVIAYFGKFGNKKIERQDKHIVITQQPKASTYKSDEKLLLGDAPIVQYRRIREELKSL